MRSILVPTDFSPNAENALTFAITIANKFDAKVELLHTYQVAKRALVLLDIESVMREEAEEKMERSIKKFKPEMNNPERLSGHVILGGAAATTSKWEDKVAADLVVMGTQGATDAIEVFVGSVTGAVLRQSKKPVLAIPSGFDFRLFNRIVLAVDDQPLPPAPVFEVLKELALAFEAEVDVFHLKTKESKGIDHQIEEYLKGVPVSYHEIADEKGEVYNRMNEFVKDNEADLLCMIRRKRGFFEALFKGSSTIKQVYNSPVPLLVLIEQQ